MARWLVILALSLGVADGALAQEPPCVMPREDLVSAQVRAVVTYSASGFSYRYNLTNNADAQQTLVMFAVEAFSTSVPVQTSPSAWSARGRIAASPFFAWSTFVQPRGLPPGTSAAGFGFTTLAPPTIVSFLAWGDAPIPIIESRPEPESCENSDIIQNSYKGLTVGPKTPPEPFAAIESVNHLIALLHESRRLGWILRDGVHQGMLTKLKDAKRRLEANDPAGANNNLKAFIAQVAGVSCEDVYCHGNQPSTSEAYAVLYFNGKYVSDRLP
jgi:hypothetical protein